MVHDHRYIVTIGGAVSRTVSKSEFKPKALEYLRQVEQSGEGIVITDRGRPVVRVEPYSSGDEVLALLRGVIVRYQDPTEPVAVEDWEAAK
jgi:prevent-host-death family protein